jgi:uncharacterized cupin superfamily protein
MDLTPFYKTIIHISSNPEGFGVTPDELDPSMFVSALPVQHSHTYYENTELGLFVGVWDTNDMVEAGGAYECDEFMWLIEGEAEIRNRKTGEMEKAGAGSAFIIPKGYDCQWHQTGYLRKFFVISQHPEEVIPEHPTHEGILIPNAEKVLAPMVTASPFLLAGDGSSDRESVCYQDVTGRFLAGIWGSEKFESVARPFPYNEFAHVQAGSITLTDDKGEEHVFDAGDAFFIPEGVVCSAKATEDIRLLFAIVHPGLS